MRHLNIALTGLVQGVGFRAAARAKARALHLTGYVRNNPDGSVALEVEGKNEGVGEFLSWIQKDFSFPGKREVSSTEGVEKQYKSFEIVI
ncbi:MAG: acylphosphatase [Patescibacteria group bacterium]|mgnify:CR=1 FL=1